MVMEDPATVSTSPFHSLAGGPRMPDGPQGLPGAGQLLAEGRFREEPPGVLGGGDLAVQVDPIGGNTQAPGKLAHKLGKPADLLIAEGPAFAVAHQADADGVAVEPVA